MDTSSYTHLCRAGHAHLFDGLAPGDVVIIPSDVNAEIERGRDLYPGILAVSSAKWAELAVLTELEQWTQLEVKAQMGGPETAHLGECAVIACAHHRNMVAILDERAAVEQANRVGVPTHDTLWIVIEAHKRLFRQDRVQTAGVVNDLLETGMYLPVDSGESLLAWAYEQGLLP